MDPLLSCLVFVSCLHSTAAYKAMCTRLQLNFRAETSRTSEHNNLHSEAISIYRSCTWGEKEREQQAHLHVIKDVETRQEARWVLSIKAERISFNVFCSRPFVIPLNRKNGIKKTSNWHRITDSIRSIGRRSEEIKRIVLQRTDESSNVAKPCSEPIVWESTSQGIERHFITTRGHRRGKESTALSLSDWIYEREILINTSLAEKSWFGTLYELTRSLKNLQLIVRLLTQRIVSFPHRGRDRSAFFNLKPCCLSNVQEMVLREHGNFKMSPWILPVPLLNTKEFLTVAIHPVRRSNKFLFHWSLLEERWRDEYESMKKMSR